MISLFEIAQNINEDDDKYSHIGYGKYKLKGKEDDDNADVFTKDDSGKYVKSADDSKGDDSEKDSGQKLGGGDFDRDGGDDKPKPDMDSDDDDDLQAHEKADKENDIIADKLDNWFNPRRAGIYQTFNLSSEESEMDGGTVHSVTRKSDDPENELLVSANPKEDQSGVEYQIGIGSGGQTMYFDTREEMMNALQVFMGDLKMQKAMNGEGDETLLDLADHAKEELKKDKEKFGETITVNGQKYKPIKEEKKPNRHILKENYERFFGDKK
jgi:hypothetical protein